MLITRNDWTMYVARLAKINATAGNLLKQYIAKNGYEDRESLIMYAHALATKYGEGAAELACEMYDAIAKAENANVPSAIPAETATIAETAKAINGSLKQSASGQMLDATLMRLVKQPAADTMLQNAKRDHAQFAWITFGDTCSFCIALSSRGWQYQSKQAMRGNHAEHIHANCDCQYAIRFNSNTNVEGYNPEELSKMYYSHDGKPNDKINAMRREAYAKNKDRINEQKRAAYAIRMGNEEG